ncbi:hypothetical protein BC834DRAFT_639729 [Gloeopeniophorella convolvens]|nr:hypothetical protein BC834DRAFT_639729 [Gloeopeniophorella convolvens]
MSSSEKPFDLEAQRTPGSTESQHGSASSLSDSIDGHSLMRIIMPRAEEPESSGLDVQSPPLVGVDEKHESSSHTATDGPNAPIPKSSTASESRIRDAKPRLDNDIESNIDRAPPGDFDNDANGLWSLYGKEAKNHDEALIQTWKEDMDGILIFAGLFSAALTAFVIESYSNLQPDPAQETVFYGQQTVVMLHQISQQLATLTPQSSASLATPQAFAFHPTPSDIRVNVFWFMSLIFSLTAALTATIVQQWVRDYMHIFQRYDHPLKSARIRQYLYEGAEGWHMPVVADMVPALVHIALFLFFIGLADFLLNINTTVAITTIAPITVCALCYLWSVIAPVINPQSPYQSSFSGLFWYISQKFWAKTYTDRGALARKPVSAEMADGRMQLAMDRSEDRKMRDVRGIRWLVGNLTEDSESEPFVTNMPGAFKTKWGRDVFMEVLGAEGALPRGTTGTGQEENREGTICQTPARFRSAPFGSPHPSLLSFFQTSRFGFRSRFDLDPHHQPCTMLVTSPGQDDFLRDVCHRVGRVIETCVTSRSLSEDVKRRHTVAAVDAAAWLVCWTKSPVEWFGDNQNMRQAVNYVFRVAVFNAQKIPDFSFGNYSLYVRCACLSLVTLKECFGRLTAQASARTAISAYALARGKVRNGARNDTVGDESDAALANARRIDKSLNTAWGVLLDLHNAISVVDPEATAAQVAEMLKPQEPLIKQLEGMQSEAEQLRAGFDQSVYSCKKALANLTNGLLYNIPFGRNTPMTTPPPRTILAANQWGKGVLFWSTFLSPGGMINVSCSFAPSFREALGDQGKGVASDFQKSATSLRDLISQIGPVMSNGHLVEQQLWRIYDLRDGGLGYTIDIFFAQVANFSNYDIRNTMSAELHQTIYVNTFRAITSGWEEYIKSLGTQHVLLNLVCELLGTRGGFRALGVCPGYLIDELLAFVGRYFRGEHGSHIDSVLEELERCADDIIRGKALQALRP